MMRHRSNPEAPKSPRGLLIKYLPHPPHVTEGLLPWLVAACIPISFGVAYIVHLIRSD